MTWSAERMTGVWPANNWRVRNEAEPGDGFVLHGPVEHVMHVVEALDAYDRAASTAPSVVQAGGAAVEPAWDAEDGVPA